MSDYQIRNRKVKELTAKQVHTLAVKTLSQHIELQSKGEKSSPDKIWDVLLSAAANNSSIDRECSEHEIAPSPNTVRGVLKDQGELEQLETLPQQGTFDTPEAILLEKAANGGN